MEPKKKKPLYRKVNTRARNVHHDSGPGYRRRAEGRQPMVQGRRRGLDYTPLFRFLLSRVGDDWDAVHSEAIRRLDRSEPIGWLVAPCREEGQPYVRVGESSYYSGLYVDGDNRLRKVAPELGPESLEPGCACCTHTFNGVPFTRRFGG